MVYVMNIQLTRLNQIKVMFYGVYKMKMDTLNAQYSYYELFHFKSVQVLVYMTEIIEQLIFMQICKHPQFYDWLLDMTIGTFVQAISVPCLLFDHLITFWEILKILLLLRHTFQYQREVGKNRVDSKNFNNPSYISFAYWALVWCVRG